MLSPSLPSAPATLLTLTQISYSLGAFLADFNETHVLNPNWPPHARFHNGQTMSLAVLLASSSIYYLYLSQQSHPHPQPPSPSPTKNDNKTNTPPPSTFTSPHPIDTQIHGSHLQTSLLLGSLYPVSSLSAILYPGADWIDPEFITPDGPRRPQLFIFGGVLALMCVGWFWEVRRVRGLRRVGG